jgi:outer membrane protease
VHKKVQINAGLWKSVTEDAGTMKDTDWEFRFYGNQPVVYSETDATVDSTQFDVNLRYDFLQRATMSLGALVGFAYTHWDWEAGNGFQTTIDPINYYQGPIEGIGITYKQDLYVPYLGAALSLFPAQSTGITLYTLYSPFAYCEDEDDHILRSKLSTGETDGNFFALGGDVRWKFKGSWSLSGKANYTWYDLDGTQDQFFYSGTNPPAGTRYTNIDLAIEGSQLYLGVMVGYEF